MLIASIVIMSVFVVFIVVTYILTIKNYKFTIEGQELKIHNQGSNLKISVNDKVVSKATMPQLLKGEIYFVKINDNDYQVKCKSNGFGNKMRVEVLKDSQVIADNGVVLPEKKIKKNNKENKQQDLKDKVEISNEESDK